jgi:hypothetical protein
VSIKFEWDPNRAAQNIRKQSLIMKKETESNDELRPEYDLTQLLKGGARGKYAERYKEGTNLVLLAPDVADAFPSEEAVNEALRLVMRLAKIPAADRQAGIESQSPSLSPP